jgi:hypothetical protein
MKRLALITTAAIAAIVGVTSLVGSSGAQAPAPPTGTLELVSPDREAGFKYVDTPPRRRENAGDQLLVTQPLRDTSNRRAGRAHASFAFTPGRPSTAQGSGTFILRDGQIVVTGTLVEGRRTDTLVIVGGSGAYAGASGTLAATGRRRSTQFVFSFAG